MQFLPNPSDSLLGPTLRDVDMVIRSNNMRGAGCNIDQIALICVDRVSKDKDVPMIEDGTNTEEVIRPMRIRLHPKNILSSTADSISGSLDIASVDVTTRDIAATRVIVDGRVLQHGETTELNHGSRIIFGHFAAFLYLRHSDDDYALFHKRDDEEFAELECRADQNRDEFDEEPGVSPELQLLVGRDGVLDGDRVASALREDIRNAERPASDIELVRHMRNLPLEDREKLLRATGGTITWDYVKQYAGSLLPAEISSFALCYQEGQRRALNDLVLEAVFLDAQRLMSEIREAAEISAAMGRQCTFTLIRTQDVQGETSCDSHFQPMLNLVGSDTDASKALQSFSNFAVGSKKASVASSRAAAGDAAALKMDDVVPSSLPGTVPVSPAPKDKIPNFLGNSKQGVAEVDADDSNPDGNSSERGVEAPPNTSEQKETETDRRQTDKKSKANRRPKDIGKSGPTAGIGIPADYSFAIRVEVVRDHATSGFLRDSEKAIVADIYGASNNLGQPLVATRLVPNAKYNQSGASRHETAAKTISVWSVSEFRNRLGLMRALHQKDSALASGKSSVEPIPPHLDPWLQLSQTELIQIMQQQIYVAHKTLAATSSARSRKEDARHSKFRGSERTRLKSLLRQPQERASPRGGTG